MDVMNDLMLGEQHFCADCDKRPACFVFFLFFLSD